jgi:hypothetical protein
MEIFGKAKEEVLKVNDGADARADAAIDAMKAKTGRFTWAAIAGVTLAIVVVFGLAIAFL